MQFPSPREVERPRTATATSPTPSWSRNDGGDAAQTLGGASLCASLHPLYTSAPPPVSAPALHPPSCTLSAPPAPPPIAGSALAAGAASVAPPSTSTPASTSDPASTSSLPGDLISPPPRCISWAEISELRYLGAGEFCTVWGATLDAGEVAVKVLKEEHNNNQLALDDLQRETQIMMGLSHPGILRVRGVGETEGKPFLVLDRSYLV